MLNQLLALIAEGGRKHGSLAGGASIITAKDYHGLGVITVMPPAAGLTSHRSDNTPGGGRANSLRLAELDSALDGVSLDSRVAAVHLCCCR